jgi:alpha-1,2-glucosyltransferase
LLVRFISNSLNYLQFAGDRSNHIAILHWPQLLYFTITALLFNALDLLYRMQEVVKLVSLRSVGKLLVYFMISLLLVKYFTFAHPFILSDNRHYIFYVWKRLFQKNELCKYYLCVPYSIAFLVINEIICKFSALFTKDLLEFVVKKQSFVWKLIYWASVGMALVPSPLIEVRYFIIPLIFLQLHARVSERVSSYNLLLYIVINAFLFYVFTLRTFVAPDGSIGRFMF